MIYFHCDAFLLKKKARGSPAIVLGDAFQIFYEGQFQFERGNHHVRLFLFLIHHASAAQYESPSHKKTYSQKERRREAFVCVCVCISTSAGACNFSRVNGDTCPPLRRRRRRRSSLSVKPLRLVHSFQRKWEKRERPKGERTKRKKARDKQQMYCCLPVCHVWMRMRMLMRVNKRIGRLSPCWWSVSATAATRDPRSHACPSSLTKREEDESWEGKNIHTRDVLWKDDVSVLFFFSYAKLSETHFLSEFT